MVKKILMRLKNINLVKETQKNIYQTISFNNYTMNATTQKSGLHFFFLAVVFGVSALLIFLLPSLYPSPFFPLLSQCDGSPRMSLCRGWGLVGGLRGLLAMGAFYGLEAGWSKWRPLDIPGTHLPLSSMQLLTNFWLPVYFTFMVDFYVYLNFSAHRTKSTKLLETKRMKRALSTKRNKE